MDYENNKEPIVSGRRISLSDERPLTPGNNGVFLMTEKTKLTTVRIPLWIHKMIKDSLDPDFEKFNGFLNKALKIELHRLGKIELTDKQKRFLGIENSPRNSQEFLDHLRSRMILVPREERKKFLHHIASLEDILKLIGEVKP